MLSSISPLGERARNQRWGVTVGAYVVASTAAGGALGAALGALGAVVVADPGPVAVAVVALGAALGVAVDLGVAGRRVPGPRRQVDETWLTSYRGWVYGAGFGAQLGLGIATVVTTSATWLAFAAALLSGSPITGLAVGATFGFVRAVPVLATARVRTPADLHRRFDRLARGEASARRAGLVAQGGVAVALAGVLVAGAGA